MEYICKICNKNYKSYQILWNHNHKFNVNHKSSYIQQTIRNHYAINYLRNFLVNIYKDDGIMK